MELLSSPLVLWAVLLLGAFFAYQRFAPRLKVRVPGANFSVDGLIGMVLGPSYAKAKFKRAVDKEKKAGNFLAAGRLLEDAEQLMEAVEVYTEGQQFMAAASVLERMGKQERAGELYLQGGDYKKAAQVFSQAGKHARAAQLFQEKGNNLEAARLYGLASQWDKSAALYMKGGFAMRAAEAYEKYGELRKAAEAYEKHFMENVTYGTTYSATSTSPEQKAALLAGRLYEKAGDLKRALEIFQRGGYFKAAADACLRDNQPHKAAELYMRAEDMASAADAFDKAGDPVQAANLRGEVAFKAGRVPEAAAFFQQGRDYLRSAELFESVGMLNEAAGAYEAGDSFAAAGNVYMRAGLKQKAAEAYERGGDAETAAKLYEEAGNQAKAIELFDRAGHTFKSGEAAARAGDWGRAIALLQRVPAGDESYLPAAQLLAEGFIATGRPALALDRIEKAIGGKPASSANLDLYYWLGAAQEAVGKGTEALSVYKQIQSEDVNFKDVDRRVKRLMTGVSVTPAAAPSSSSSPMPAAEGEHLGKYVLGRKLGQGAMGEVFRAHDPVLKRDVAIKMIAASIAPESELRVRFEREAQSAARLNHPNIITVYEFGEERGKIYMVMELLDGHDLRDLINRRALPTLGDKVAVMEQLCDGLAYAHSHEIVHRDLKPGNIHVLPNGQAKILDFGLARLGSAEFTQSGMMMGTPHYMSPEQARGEHVDARSDIFSLGAVFYELLSNHKAFDADSMHGVLYQVINDEPDSVRKWVPDLPDALIAVIERSLNKDPSRRYPTAVQMYGALKQVRTALSSAQMSQRSASVASAPPPRMPAPAAPTAPPVKPPAAVPAPSSGPGKGARFVPQAEIGRGPKGVVFRGGDATDPAQAVALRFLEPEPLKVDGALAALSADLKAAASVVHPHIVKLIGFVEIGGKRCLVTELVPGKNFAEPLLAGRRVPFAHMLGLTRALAETVQMLHARGLVHGSIQPANIMASGAVVKLADLGLGRVFQRVSKAREYWPAEGRFDTASDLYAAAGTVYHLLTGVHPRAQPTLAPPSRLVPGVPAAFDAILMRALAPAAQERFASAAALVAALNQFGTTGG